MNRKFLSGMAMGAAAGMVFGLVMMSRRHQPTPMEHTRMVVGRSARHAMRKARNAWGQVAGRFSD
ncbi:MAG: hypothetical protein ACM3WU_05805 [Bacillota bacterium]